MPKETLLKQIRSRSGKTTYQVGSGIDVDQSTYSRIERGEINVSPELAAKIAAMFDVPMVLIFSPARYTAATEAAETERVIELEAKAS